MRVRGTGRRLAVLLVAATVIGVGLDTGVATAWPGDPDGTWGSCGLRSAVITPDKQSEATSVLVDGSGSQVVGGWVGTQALVAKFLADGNPDPSFGTGGETVFTLGSDADFAAVARQSDGKVVAVGSATTGDEVDSLVARVKTDGIADLAFHGDGRLVGDFGGTDRLAAVRIQLNGAIVVGGASGADGIVARLGTSGTLDASFSGDGMRTDLPLTVEDLILLPDGKIVVGGRTASDDFALMRLNPDGTTDETFGGASGVQTDLGGYDSANALALDVDGNVVAAGVGHGPKGGGHTIVQRYDPDGNLDGDFLATDRAFGLGDDPVALLITAEGKVLVAANSKVGADNDVLLVRLNGDGTRDAAFGIGGVSLLDAGSYPVVTDLALQSNGRALVAGSLRVAGRKQLARLRFQSDAETAVRPAQGFVLDGTGGLSGFSAGCTGKPAAAAGLVRWPAKDVARGVALLPGGRGIVVEASGALHPFRFGDGPTAELEIRGNATWKSDMARGVAVVPEGTGGYVVDRTGRLHEFKIGAGPRPVVPADVVTWPGLDQARGVALLPNGVGGYVLDASGGLHPFGGAPKSTKGAPQWPGQDRARGVAIAPDGSSGWVLDSFGNLYPFGIGDNPKPAFAALGGPTWTTPTARGVATLP